MTGNEIRYPCHIHGAADVRQAYDAFRGELVKDYGDCVCRRDGSVLHWNHVWDDGGRRLVRCSECGGLLLMQRSEFHSFTDSPDGYYQDWIPAASEEEADLLNILLDAGELEDFPCRHFRSNNGACFMTRGDEPRPRDPDGLRRQILEKYGLRSLNEIGQD